MRDPWVQAALDQHQDLGSMRAAVERAMSDGRPLEPLWTALADEDPTLLGAIALDAGLLAHAEVLDATLGVLDVLEESVAPGVLAQLLWKHATAPQQRDRVRSLFARRHPASLLNDPLTEGEEPRGRTWVREALEAGHALTACERCAAQGFDEALLRASRTHASLEPAVALIRANRFQSAAAAAAAALDAHPGLPLLPWLAAVYGPKLEPLLLTIARMLRSPEARATLRRSATDFPGVQHALTSAQV